MKQTKKQRKLRNGMNHATDYAFNQGYFRPSVNPITGAVSKGSPYVNPRNFGM